MSRTQYYCAASLDGFIADSDGGVDWLTDYEGSFEGRGAELGPTTPEGAYESFYARVGALVSGSATYEFLLAHLSGGGSWPYAGKPYWVLSSRDLPTPGVEGADVRIRAATAAELHTEIRAVTPSKNLWIVGGGSVASQFASAGLLDEVIVTCVPVVLGAGKPLFDQRLGAPMELSAARAFANGMVELSYAVGQAPEPPSAASRR